MNITTKAQHLIKTLGNAQVEVTHAVEVMNDADISTSMWAEIKEVQNHLNAIIQVLEENENAK